MSPELVHEISWFLTECAKLRETVLITGNHDCNLNNSHRLDVLTPIIENLGNNRIHYLRDTGVYNIHNLTFVVYSILDNKENWPKGDTVDGENKIVLFHGPVNKVLKQIYFIPFLQTHSKWICLMDSICPCWVIYIKDKPLVRDMEKFYYSVL